jgi:D-galactarolactone cycloisomerase
LPILERVRAETDDQIDLMVDANGAYSLPLAIEVGRKLEELKFRWFEEPLIRGRSGMNYPGYEGLARLDIPIAAAEGLQNRSAFHHILNRGGVDIIQPDVAICGGIGEAAFIAELAALHGKPCVPHAWGGAILLAATLQLVSLIPEPSEVVGPSSPLLEFDRFENRMRTEVSVTPISVVDGFVAIPSAPGLGIEIDETALRSFIHSPEE